MGELLNAPQIPIQKEYYPSGVKEVDKYYSTDLPSKTFPLLKIETAAYDAEFNKLESGIYSIVYSPEQNALLIGDAENILKAQVIQKIKTKTAQIPSARVVLGDNNRIFVIYKNKNLEIHGFLYLPAAVLEGF